MKSKLNVLIILLSMVFLAACSTPAQKKLKQEVEKINTDCPIKVMDGIVIDHVSYQKDTVTYFASVNTPLISLKLMNKTKDLIKPLLVKAIKNAPDSTLQAQLQLCKDAEAQLQFVLSKGDDILKVDINPAEDTK